MTLQKARQVGNSTVRLKRNSQQVFRWSFAISHVAQNEEEYDDDGRIHDNCNWIDNCELYAQLSGSYDKDASIEQDVDALSVLTG